MSRVRRVSGWRHESRVRPRPGPGFYGPRMGDFTRDLKQLVWLRDGGHCNYCGTAVWQGDIHHRRPRGMGGRDSHEDWINHQSNLVLLCRRCHDHLEAEPAVARRTGYRLDVGQVPDEVPVRCWDGMWVLLHGADYRTPVAPPALNLTGLADLA